MLVAEDMMSSFSWGKGSLATFEGSARSQTADSLNMGS
jgi:hypothetical protein